MTARTFFPRMLGCFAMLLLALAAPGRMASSLEAPRTPAGGAGRGRPGGAGAKAGALDVLLWMAFSDSLTEPANVTAVLEASGATVRSTATTLPDVFLEALLPADALVLVEPFGSSLVDEPDPRLQQLAAALRDLAPSMRAFLQAGHPVVVMDGDLSATPGITELNALGITYAHEVQESAGLGALILAAPTDPLLNGIQGLSGASGDMTFVSDDPRFRPVVTWAQDPGQVVVARMAVGRYTKLVYLGFDFFTFTDDHARLLVNACHL